MKYFWLRPIIANISTKPNIVDTTAVTVIMPLVFIIIKRLPTKRTTAETRLPILWLRDWLMVSTSLVTRERISPVVV